MDSFKTQQLVDQWLFPIDWKLRPVPGGYHCIEQLKPVGIGPKRQSTSHWVFKSSLAMQRFACIKQIPLTGYVDLI